jgi:hypothetical protein
MENPDTLIELHRTVVEQMFGDRFPPRSIDPKPFTALVIEGEAQLHVAVSRVWFHQDASGRPWRQRDGSITRDLDRHFAFDFRLGDHPPELELPNSRLVFTKVLGLPIPPVPATSCNNRQILFNEIPLFGRLVIHDSLERVETTIDGRPHQNVVLEFAPQAGPLLEAGVPEPGFDSEMFGPDVQSEPGGRVVLTGTEPHVVWELTPAEQDCIRETTVGQLLSQVGIDPIALVAAELATGVTATLATSGDDETSRASILPKPHPVDPTGASGDPFAVDGVVRRWTRQGGGPVPEESLQIQIQTVDMLPDPLPDSVLASSTDETVGFMRSGFAILRSIRTSQISSLCLASDGSDFDPNAGCLLVNDVDIQIGENDATLVEFSATIEPSAALGHDLLHINGRAENDSWHSGWYVEFGMQFRLDRGDVPRDPLVGELPPDLQPSRTLKEMNDRLRELGVEKCAGGDAEAIEEERKQIATEKLLLPTEVGVKPLIFGEPERDSDFWWTTAGIIFGIALLGAVAVLGYGIAAFAAAKFATAAVSMAAWFIVGSAVALVGMAVLDDFLFDAKVSDGLKDFVNEKKEQGGDALPLEGYSPTTVLLKDGVLRVFLAPLPRKLSVRYFEPDERSPGDLDRASQQIAGLLADGRMWQLSVADAAHLIERGRLTMSIDPSATPGGQAVPIHVARSSRGRRYLRTPPDDEATNNLANLPRIPTP